MKQLFKCNDTMIIEIRIHMTLKIIFIWHSFYKVWKRLSGGDYVCLSVWLSVSLFICLSVCDLAGALNCQILMKLSIEVLTESGTARASVLKSDSVTTFL